jgi:hypothetical protein
VDTLSYPPPCSEKRGAADFTGMLAHSMEHIAERQSTHQATLGRMANPGNIPLIFAGRWSGCSDNMAIPVGFLAIRSYLTNRVKFADAN